jgi:molecular chaperone Hsp33
VPNALTSFAFESQVAHGAFVELSLGVEEMLGQRAYSPDVRALVGEAIAAMPLLATHMNFEGRINLQFRGEGRMKLMVAQIANPPTGQLQVRGMAQAPGDLSGSFTELLYNGLLALMLEPTGDTRPASQALVLIQGNSLGDALEHYFLQSEQLPTLIQLASRPGRLAGFLLQRLPMQSARGGDEDWERLVMLGATLGREELLDTDPQTLLRRIYGNEDVRVFEPRPVTVACRCSRAGIARLLLSLGREEVESIIAEQGQVAVSCEFCGREYRFSPHEAAELFLSAGGQSSTMRH